MNAFCADFEGSAFKAKGIVEKIMQKVIAKQASSISDSSERRKVENVYALKSIQLDRVKPLYVDELLNEIKILKVGRTTSPCSRCEEHTKTNSLSVSLQTTDHPNIVKGNSGLQKSTGLGVIG
jgi:hypothetical protein